jgi:hypothetical protein
LADVCARLDALELGAVDGGACASLVEAIARVEKVCSVVRVRLAARAAQCGAHRAAGFAEPAEWLARVSGVSAAGARSDLATVAALASCPNTADAVAAGELSLAQAKEIVGAEAVAPGAEHELLEVARSNGISGLRERARRVRLDAVDVEQLHREQHRRREVRHWRDELGMVCLHAALPPEVGVAFVHRLDVVTDRLRRAAKRAGGYEERAAHAADALVAMTATSGASGMQSGAAAARRAPRAEVVLVGDIRAVARGHAHDGEPCHIVGGGPVPVSVVRDALPDAFVKLVTHDGTKIEQVVHLGRRIPAVLRTALELGAPPRFDGVTCVEDGCDRRYGLEWDHVDPVANGGPTSVENLKCRCRPCHRAKTERDRAAGLLGRQPARVADRAPP